MIDPVRPLVVIAGGEALAALVMTVVVAIAAPGSDLDSGIPVATVVMWLILSAGLALIWWGLFRRRRAAHSPFLLAQALALVVAWLLVPSDVAVDRAAGVLLAIGAVLGLVMGLRPAVLESLAVSRAGGDPDAGRGPRR